jgi:hypothetical protein
LYLAAKGTDGLTYVPARDGARVDGTYCRAVTLPSGKFAVILNGQQFTLVPWRALLERYRGREVVGISAAWVSHGSPAATATVEYRV